MPILIILPHQLFDLKYLKEYDWDKIILWEHPHYFTRMNFNKKKLILHRASMKHYQNKLNKKYKTHYLEFDNDIKKKIDKDDDIYMFDSIDKINFDSLLNDAKILESPNFLLTREDYQEYRDKTDKFFFHFFYTWGKKKIDVIPNIKSKDKENRKKIPTDLKIPELPTNLNKDDQKYIDEAIKYVEKNFKNNYGVVDEFLYPISHNVAKKWLHAFIKQKFKEFGPYQDAIVENENFLFHSILSTSINIGLLNPSEILEIIGKSKSKIPINSYEAYVRQLFWREYQRYTYIYADFSGNYFNNRKKLGKEWYRGETGILPVDNAIVRAFYYGYLHHIERLMVVGNFMNLSGISPKEGYKWFMEFSCDSYDWVMHQNVLDMVFFVSGGKTMRKPYVSSSNYVLKMSNYKKGEWSEEWDDLYWKFMKRNKQKLWKYRYYFPSITK